MAADPVNTVMQTLSQALTKCRSVNQTSSSFVSKVPTNTEPKKDAGTATGASVLDLNQNGVYAANAIKVVPYCTGADDVTFSVRVIGWHSVGNDPATMLWIPVTLAELACTGGTTVGVAGMVIVATERFADTIALTTGNANVSCDVNSPADNTIAHAVIDLKGSQKVELSFTTGSSATDCNALISVY